MDKNGNLTSDGTNTHTWDRANRLLSVGNHSYAYDGNGARIQKTVSSVVTDYLLDVQRGLTQVLRESDGTNTQHYIHAPRGIHAMNDGSNWSYMLQDGLGSVRVEIAQNVAVNGSQNYTPYGEVFGVSGSFDSPFGFTGEQTDSNGQVYLRARYYNPSMGVFNALDPFEGSVGRPMSLNGYSWVEGNPVMNVDPSGNCVPKLLCATAFIDPCDCFRNCSPQPSCEELQKYGCREMYNKRGDCLFGSPTLPVTPLPPATSTPIGAIANLEDWEIKLLAYAMVREDVNIPENWTPQAYVFLNRLLDTSYDWSCGSVGSRKLQCVLQGSNNLAIAVSAFHDGNNHFFDLLTLNEDQMESFWDTCMRGDCGSVTPQLLQQALPILTDAVAQYATGSNPYAGLRYFAHFPTAEDANYEAREAQCLGDSIATNVGTLYLGSKYSSVKYDGDVTICST